MANLERVRHPLLGIEHAEFQQNKPRFLGWNSRWTISSHHVPPILGTKAFLKRFGHASGPIRHESGKVSQRCSSRLGWENKATGWLGALVRVTNLKFWFLRLRDKMLVFAGVVKKCLQHGHSFRLAGVWLKSENLRFACAVTRFCSSRVK